MCCELLCCLSLCITIQIKKRYCMALYFRWLFTVLSLDCGCALSFFILSKNISLSVVVSYWNALISVMRSCSFLVSKTHSDSNFLQLSIFSRNCIISVFFIFAVYAIGWSTHKRTRNSLISRISTKNSVGILFDQWILRQHSYKSP